MTASSTVRAGHVVSEGDELYYEVRGSGPPLLLIHGAIIDAGGFARVADLLAADYTVITYDRRGYSRSSRHDPRNFEISQQARDALAVLRAEGHEAAAIAGNSGGAIIGLELARAYPQSVSILVAHEPPAMRVLPDAAEKLAEAATVYRTALLEGAEQGMRLFFQHNPTPRTEVNLAATAEDELARRRGNIDFFLKHELLPFANYQPDVAAIRANAVRVVLGVGELSADAGHGQTVPILARQLGSTPVIFPGHHTSYIGMADEWAGVLRRVMGDG